ncbi:MAG: GIY-YIG nuclease family protein [Deltaproteobacteria bacterium]|nr:GIY-YIG nuclease family protein [Deltaproteobacteria bacterium]
MVEIVGIIVCSFLAWNFFNEIMKGVNKRKDRKESQRKHAIFTPYFDKYYPKIKELKTVQELETYKKSLPDPNSAKIKKLENQTGRNIIHEAQRWIDDDIKKLKEETAKLQEIKSKEEKIKKDRDAKEEKIKRDRDAWVNERHKLEKSKGFVYILSNASMPNIIKIGYSTKKPHERANELYTTGVPTPFTVLHAWSTPTERIAQNLERHIHQKFANSRLHGNREFFNINCLSKVKMHLEENVGKEITYY